MQKQYPGFFTNWQQLKRQAGRNTNMPTTTENDKR
jgi:hypothetical protein